MKTEEIEWYSNRIKGSVAEAACRCHFEALGFSVESFGIEHIAPRYAALTAVGKSALGNYARSLQQQLRTIPDFLITRTYADTQLNRIEGLVGKVEAVLVEAKFRGEATYAEIEQEFYERYSAQISTGMNVLIYLVARRFRRSQNDAWKMASIEGASFVHLCFYSSSLFGRKPNRCGGFVPAGHSLMSNYPLYQGKVDAEDFNTVYRTVISPALSSLIDREESLS